MKKYRCTLTSGSFLYYATVIAGDEQHAKELAATEADSRWSGCSLGTARWNVAQLESGVSGPARVIDCDYKRV